MADSRLSWFPPEPSVLHLAQGDSALLLAAVRDTTGDTLDLANLPAGHLAYEIRYPPIVTIRAGERDTLLGVFRVHIRADSPGTDTVRLAWLTPMCLARTSPFGPRECFDAAWFAPMAVPIDVR